MAQIDNSTPCGSQLFLNQNVKRDEKTGNIRSASPTNRKRRNCKDLWNAFMVQGCEFSANDIPLCPSTTDEFPKSIITYSEAKTIFYKKIRSDKVFHNESFVCFYEDDQNFDGPNGVWNCPKKAYEILKHFEGIIAPDFSTYLDFPKPLKIYNLYKMNAFGYWYGQICNKKVIANARWDFDDSFDYCFDGIKSGDIVSIGILASGLKSKENRELLEQGLKHLITTKSIKKIILYGSGNYRFLDWLFDDPNLEVQEYECRTHKAYRRKKNEIKQ